MTDVTAGSFGSQSVIKRIDHVECNASVLRFLTRCYLHGALTRSQRVCGSGPVADSRSPSIRPNSRPPERAPIPAVSNTLQVEDRREGSTQVQDQKSCVPRAVPRHVAVIMDGNRRYGRTKYGDPLKVCYDL